MSKREDCQRRGCGHDKATHFSELPSTGDSTNPAESGRLVYWSCLYPLCDCKKYEAPRE